MVPDSITEWLADSLKERIRALPIVVEGQQFYVNLIELEIDDFDVILGMDMLSKYGATIDCKRRNVTFAPEGETPFVLVGSAFVPRVPMISALGIRGSVQWRCTGYLASVGDTTRSDVTSPGKTQLFVTTPTCFLTVCRDCRHSGRLSSSST